MPAAAPTAGARTASPASATTSSGCASRWPCGTAAIPILKERLFGLTNSEGNHGEDVKELLLLPRRHADALLPEDALQVSAGASSPTRGWSRRTAAAASIEPEFELLDTGIFDDDRYFDVFVEYAKAGPDDMLMRVTVHNRGPDEAVLHLLPQLWFRNTWSWKHGCRKPELWPSPATAPSRPVHTRAGRLLPLRERRPEIAVLRQRNQRPPRSSACRWRTGYVKDAFHDYIVHGNRGSGQSAADGHQGRGSLRARRAGPAARRAIRLRLTQRRADRAVRATSTTSSTQRQQRGRRVLRRLAGTSIADADARNVQRQALAGMIWSKQFYHYDVARWLEGDPAAAAAAAGSASTAAITTGRTSTTPTSSRCPTSGSIPGTPPGTWPSTASPLALIDPEFAKDQLVLLTREWYMHPNGQLPAYEWAFGDVNPPVHAWAAWRVFQIDRKQRGGRGDLAFPGARLPQAAAQLHLVGQPQGRRRAATSSRAASSAWTTSASSTAARRCPPAAIIDQADGTAGWRCTA